MKALYLATVTALMLTPALAQTTGQGGSVIQGSAGPAGTTDASRVEKCGQPFGALAVLEPQDFMERELMRYGLQSPTQLLRLIVQQSNCFTVVERGMALRSLQQERDLQRAGELRSGSSMGKGQMIAADYVLTPSVVFRESDAGAIGGVIGGIVGGGSSRAAAGLLGGLKFREAQTAITLADVRTSMQVAAAEGSARKTDFRLGAGYSGAAVGGYTSTNEGKMVAASFLDNWNQVVRSIRGSLSLPSAQAPATGLGADAGDVLVPKIDGIRVYAEPSSSAKVLGTLGKDGEMVFLGEEQNGFLHVQDATGEGWVQAILVRRAD